MYTLKKKNKTVLSPPAPPSLQNLLFLSDLSTKTKHTCLSSLVLSRMYRWKGLQTSANQKLKILTVSGDFQSVLPRKTERQFTALFRRVW